MGTRPGPVYPVQVWKVPVILTYDPETGNATGAEAVERQLIKNVKLCLDEGYFELGCTEDGLVAVQVSSSAGNGQLKYTWEPAKIGITLALELDEYLLADTGQDNSSGVRLPFARDGLTEQLNPEKYQYVQLTNVGYAIKSPSGGLLVFGAVIFNEDGQQWQEFTSQAVVRDDSDILSRAAAEILKCKSRRHQSYNIEVPWFARAYRPGIQLAVRGQAHFGAQPLMITGVRWDLETNATGITADNVKPPARSEVSM